METIQHYIERHTSPQPDHLTRLERESNLRLINGRMCSGHLQGRLLKMLTEMIRPTTVVELGTFSGFSALCIAEGLPESGRIISIEADDELEDFIRRQLSGSPFGGKVDLRIGDALAICAGMPDNSADMMFMDADKRQYCQYYREAMRIVRPGGYILADNTLWDGHVVEERYANDRQTSAIREFNDLVAADPDSEQVMLPLRDGLTIIRRIR